MPAHPGPLRRENPDSPQGHKERNLGQDTKKTFTAENTEDAERLPPLKKRLSHPPIEQGGLLVGFVNGGRTGFLLFVKERDRGRFLPNRSSSLPSKPLSQEASGIHRKSRPWAIMTMLSLCERHRRTAGGMESTLHSKERT